MKTKCFAIFAVLLLLSFTAVAADPPKAEVFGGYQYTRLDIADLGAINANGWNAAVTGNVNKWFGVTADFSGAYKTVFGVSGKLHTYTFGPVFTARSNEHVTPFFHTLFGGFHANAGFGGTTASTNGFAMMVGGGVDAKVGEHLALRVVQADWMMFRAEGVTEKKNIRISTGLVFRF